MTKLIIYGIGDFAKMMYYYLTNEPSQKYEIVAFCVDSAFKTCSSFCGLDVVAFEEVEIRFPPSSHVALLAVGYKKMRNREMMFKKIKSKDYTLINYFHPSVNIRNLKYGENNIILSQCCIEPFVEIGSNNIIWSSSFLGHNAKIQNHNYISAKCLIAGNINIGSLCFIGNGAVTINNINIADETYIVASSLARKDTKEHSMYMGNPMRLINTHKENGIEIL